MFLKSLLLTSQPKKEIPTRLLITRPDANSVIRTFFFRFTSILIQTSATILSSLCSELVTCTSFVREYAKN